MIAETNYFVIVRFTADLTTWKCKK